MSAMTTEAALLTHPDAEIAAEIEADALAAEMADLVAGYPPRRWTCPCGASHSRGVQPNGGHRCLRCGYIGTGGTLSSETSEGPRLRRAHPSGGGPVTVDTASGAARAESTRDPAPESHPARPNEHAGASGPSDLPVGSELDPMTQGELDV